MTTALARRVAASIARSGLSEDILVYLAGVEYPARATVIRPEEAVTDGAGKLIRRQTTLRFPVASLPERPLAGDTIEVGGRTLFVVTCLELGAVFQATVSARRPD